MDEKRKRSFTTASTRKRKARRHRAARFLQVVGHRERLVASIAPPAPAAISPARMRPSPIQSTRLVFAPTFTAAPTWAAPFAFITTIDQLPPLTFQLVVTWPRPLPDDRQKLWRAGGPAGARPACARYLTGLTSVTSLRATPAR